jgi:hypothetical protein
MSVVAFISVCIRQIEIWCKRPDFLSIWLRPAMPVQVLGGGGSTGRLNNQLQACNGNAVSCT